MCESASRTPVAAAPGSCWPQASCCSRNRGSAPPPTCLRLQSGQAGCVAALGRPCSQGPLCTAHVHASCPVHCFFPERNACQAVFFLRNRPCAGSTSPVVDTTGLAQKPVLGVQGIWARASLTDTARMPVVRPDSSWYSSHTHSWCDG